MQAHHISVCICTFKRPDLLRELLAALSDQKTDNLFTYSVVVADNDPLRSAESVVTGFTATTRLTVKYCVQPLQNIALTRNTALQHADEGDLIAFIDDDELPTGDWLYQLLKRHLACEVAGVLGPVKPRFEFEPPKWVKRGRFFDRPTHATGYRLSWTEARTGNVLFAKAILDGAGAPFNSEFDAAGEDMDFFRRMMEKGHVFVWCDEAPVYEVVPPSRCTRTYLFRRALLRGSNFSKHPADRVKNVAKSIIAVPCYTALLPIFLVLGQHLFIRYFVKLLDHGSRILAFLGLRLVTERTT
jgi:succinoglycan biosynthesis protein ExoM